MQRQAPNARNVEFFKTGKVPRPIPQFVVTRPTNENEFADFPTFGFRKTDSPDAVMHMALLLFSTAEKARAFITANLDADGWQVRYLDYLNLRTFLRDPDTLDRCDCALIDRPADQKPTFLHGFDIHRITRAIKQAMAENKDIRNTGEEIKAESWTVFI